MEKVACDLCGESIEEGNGLFPQVEENGKVFFISIAFNDPENISHLCDSCQKTIFKNLVDFWDIRL
jgi:cupin superfamily acireductone dioxygenase involved in methionine salvage